MHHIFLKAEQLPGDLAKELSNVFGTGKVVSHPGFEQLSGFGFLMKVERNNYDFKHKYDVMLSLNPDHASEVKTDDAAALAFFELVCRLLVLNTSYPMATEGPEGFKALR